MSDAALIVAHGAPSDPAPQEAALAALAAEVTRLSGRETRSATLAMPGALEAALPGVGVVYPFFMAGGWFTRSELPRRLGGAKVTVLPPFGEDPALVELAVELVRSSVSLARRTAPARPQAGAVPALPSGERGPSDALETLLLAAHGSGRSPVPKAATEAFAAALRARLPNPIVTGYIEEPPFLRDEAALPGPALCLPFFALTAGHVTGDIPEALHAARFPGPTLPPIGAAPGVPALIAAAIARGVPSG